MTDDARMAARARRRARLTRLRRWAHVVILPFVAAALAPDEAAEAVLGAGLVAALAVGVCLQRLAGPGVRAALDGSRAVRALDLALWNAALVVLCLEGALTLASRAVKSPLLTAPNAKSAERVRDYRFAPYAPYLGGKTNAWGFNDTDWVTPKPEGTFRIVALGDSFHFGVVPYAQNFLTLLEADLTARVGVPVEVCNLGISGTSPIDYLFVLNDEGRLLEPDLVLTGLFVGNDIGVVRTGSRLRPSNWLTFAVFKRISRILAERRRNEERTTPPDEERGISTVMSPDFYLNMVAEIYLPVFAVAREKGMERRWEDTLRVLERIGGLAGDGRHVIAVYPCEPQVDHDLLRRACEHLKADPAGFDVHAPARRVVEHFAPKAVPVLDVLPALLARRDEGRAYVEHETHWNGLGNRIAAATLAEQLEPLVRARLGR
ncbi:MAG: SGNH/GDSL hydrolase family protein [Planctomycetes bacterium]|nr:SGNH/GDSL hydrolase family protein [Planctomycetota bacterium]